MLKIYKTNVICRISKDFSCIRSCKILTSNTLEKKKKKKELPSKINGNIDKSVKKDPKKSTSSKYKHTIFLPYTKFPNFIKDMLKHELELQTNSQWNNLYSSQRSDPRRETEFVLHDGPPYANGDLHIGHALNKILKDISGRQKLLEGYKLHFVPGWDCHGLPIELKALYKVTADNVATNGATATIDHTTIAESPLTPDSKYKRLEPLEIRKIARDFSERCVSSQRGVFQRWGVLADWSNSYITSHPSYVARQLRLFDRLRIKGLIYQAHLPVFFSPSSGSTLAESELEYKDDHVSPALTVAMRAAHPLPHHLQCQLDAASGGRGELWLPVFTTTPWTLPFNRAVCYNPGLQYRLVTVTKEGRQYAMLWAKELVYKITEAGLQWTDWGAVQGDISGVSYAHPLSGCPCPLLPAEHVTAAMGTGLVHTAPAHGHDDYMVGVQHSLQLDSATDDEGRYTAGLGHGLDGLPVLSEGNTAVMRILDEFESSSDQRVVVLDKRSATHSYPYDWRTKQPVMIRATKQWFIDTQALREPAMACLGGIQSHPYPETAAKNLSHQLSRRHWCISRQRVWGTPLPVFYDAHTHQPLLNTSIVEHVCGVVERSGGDAWWRLPVEDLLPPRLLEEYREQGRQLPTKGKDILDIWLDSGSSWLTLEGRTADLLIEGVDQYRGWFLSTLLTSIADTGAPAYKRLLVHGFTVDEFGRKMSKSEGNVVAPSTITDGDDGRKAMGADVLRWWVCRTGTLHDQPTCSAVFLGTLKDEVHRLRSILKFLLGCLKGYEPGTDAPELSQLTLMDRYALHRLHVYDTTVWTHYRRYEYHSVALNTIVYTNKELSQIYFVYIKHRLYCTGDGTERSCIQYILHQHLQRLLTNITPILPHLAQDVANHLTTGSQSPQLEIRSPPPSWWHFPESESVVSALLQLKDHLNSTISSSNNTKLDVCVQADPSYYHKLKRLQPEDRSDSSIVCEVLQCASVMLSKLEDASATGPLAVSVSESSCGACVRCRKYRAGAGAELCAECSHVIRALL